MAIHPAVKIIGAGFAAVVTAGLVAKKKSARREYAKNNATPVHQAPKKLSEKLVKNKEKKKTRSKNSSQPKAARTAVEQRATARKMERNARRNARRKAKKALNNL